MAQPPEVTWVYHEIFKCIKRNTILLKHERKRYLDAMIGDLNEKQNRLSRKRKASRPNRHPPPMLERR